MIIELLLDAIEAGIIGLLSLFPETTIDPFSFIQDVAGSLGALNYFLPISETFALVVGVLTIFPLFAGTTLSLWVLAQLRGSSSRG